MNKYLLLFLLFIVSLANAFATLVSGRITDKDGIRISGARVIFTNIEDGRRFQAYSDADGYYNIEATSVTEMPENRDRLYNYPNPFNSQTVISFYIGESGPAELAVYNMSGQKVHVIQNRYFTHGQHQILFDTRMAQGRIGQGVYICALRTRNSQQSIRMIVLGGENVAAPAAEFREPVQTRVENSKSASSIYNAVVSGSGFKDHIATGIDLSNTTSKDFIIDRTVWTPFSTVGDYLGIYNGTDYTPFFIKGINLGTAVAGAWPGQIAISAEQYARWFRMMADAGFNTVRIYTLHYPRFYEEFARYNRENPAKPLYLLQGVWLDEMDENPYWNGDLHELTTAFDNDIKDMIDCLHGNKTLSHRYGYAYGDFTADVSQWLLGLIIGREIYASEIIETDLSKPTNTAYSGTHFSISNASPSEVWATERLDRLVKYERDNYGTNRPVSFSSWPTLDPLPHPSEPLGSMEDDAEMNLNKIEPNNAPGGFFISYHIYSYYPNFINRDEKYQNVTDEMGANPYLGYLRDLRAHYTNYPVLIAEFGVPTSWIVARYAPSGMHHGGLNEKEQGEYTMRMFRNIYDSRYCGGVTFSWMDEWFKTTWITHPLTSGNRRLWHNVTSPENNYGLIHFVPNPSFFDVNKKTQNYNFAKISQATVWHDFSFFNVDAKLKSPLGTGDTLWIAFDTYKRNIGESTLPNGKKVLINRAEFLLRVTADSALLYVTKAYNLQGVSQYNPQSPTLQTKATDGEPWVLCRWQSDVLWNYPNTQDVGKLAICKENEKLEIHHAVQIRSDGVYVRIPWTLLNFSDPSNSMVIDDNESFLRCSNNWACGWNYLKSIRSDGIAVTLVYNNEIAQQSPYTWNNWNLNSQDILSPNMFIEVEKASLSIIRESLRNTPFTPKSK